VPFSQFDILPELQKNATWYSTDYYPKDCGVFSKPNLLRLTDGLRHNRLRAKCSTTKLETLTGVVLGVHITYYLL
jgi:hypothetical protein